MANPAFWLQQPASSTPSTPRRSRIKGGKSHSKDARKVVPLSSPLLSKACLSYVDIRKSLSSPLERRALPLPSPSPERQQEVVIITSSPPRAETLKATKTVTFHKELVQPPSKVTTPRKSILKTRNDSAQLEIDLVGGSKYSHLEFWSKGEIVTPKDSSSADELKSFSDILNGGMTVLKDPKCNVRFEIYASFQGILKNINDKKIDILLPLLTELVRILQHDQQMIENELKRCENPNPFLTRTDVQIVKVMSFLLSSEKIYRRFWKKSPKEVQSMAKNSVVAASLAITSSTIPKSLLTASLQLLKDQKVHALLPQSVKETVVASLMNTKQFSTLSVLQEKLNCLKSMITACPTIMEKTVKSWAGFVLNSICDFNSPFSKKLSSVASITLAEASKIFLTSKPVCYEIRKMLAAPIYTTLSVEPSTQISVSSTPVDLQQPTIEYICDRLYDLIEADSIKVALDIWVSITLIWFDDLLMVDVNSPWVKVIETCLQDPKVENRNLALKSWKAVVYVTCGNIALLTSEHVESQLETMFHIYDEEYSLGLSVSSEKIICSLTSRILYGMFSTTESTKWLSPQLFETYVLNSMTLTKTHAHSWNYMVQLLVRLLQPLTNMSRPTYLTRVLSDDAVELLEIKPLTMDIVFQVYPKLMSIFTNDVWMNPAVEENVQLALLAALMGRVRSIPQNQIVGKRAERISAILKDLKRFFPMYMDHPNAQNVKSKEALEYVNRFLTLIKTNFGPMSYCTDVNSKGELEYSHENIYVEVIKYCIIRGFREVDILKCLLFHVKGGLRLRLFESLALKIKNRKVLKYISNNLESTLFDKNITITSVNALGRTISILPKTSPLLGAFIRMIHSFDSPGSLFSSLNIPSWSFDDILLLLNLVSDNDTLKSTLLGSISTKLNNGDSKFASKLFRYLSTTADNDTLFSLNRELFFYAMDPRDYCTETSHSAFVDILKSFLHAYQGSLSTDSPDLRKLDVILSHGLQLCKGVLLDEKYKHVWNRSRDINEVLDSCIAVLPSEMLNRMPLVLKELENDVIPCPGNHSSEIGAKGSYVEVLSSTSNNEASMSLSCSGCAEQTNSMEIILEGTEQSPTQNKALEAVHELSKKNALCIQQEQLIESEVAIDVVNSSSQELVIEKPNVGFSMDQNSGIKEISDGDQHITLSNNLNGEVDTVQRNIDNGKSASSDIENVQSETFTSSSTGSNDGDGVIEICVIPEHQPPPAIDIVNSSSQELVTTTNLHVNIDNVGTKEIISEVVGSIHKGPDQLCVVAPVASSTLALKDNEIPGSTERYTGLNGDSGNETQQDDLGHGFSGGISNPIDEGEESDMNTGHEFANHDVVSYSIPSSVDGNSELCLSQESDKLEGESDETRGNDFDSFKNVEDSIIRPSVKRKLDDNSYIGAVLKKPHSLDLQIDLTPTKPKSNDSEKTGQLALAPVHPQGDIRSHISSLFKQFRDDELSKMSIEEIFQVEDELLGFISRMRSLKK
ncbi:RIF1 [Cyberlindnera jadinii]|uniref:RIF1 protein n=1 Tax=Cyberlindnera jadinii (strain ATCC 18201 / CBS 1600 / BCRC 20928 / JCM 3617 / NBRC 0987 / NRRL Y-1542) TaxID=983966 RepID=A0A0H5C8D6_CYBJN|nr:RIF1 [Cyberlindnera jadinii]